MPDAVLMCAAFVLSLCSGHVPHVTANQAMVACFPARALASQVISESREALIWYADEAARKVCDQ